MISKSMRLRPVGWVSGVVVVATSALTLGLPLAGTAAAAASAVSATPTSQNVKAGSTANITVTSTGTPTDISYTILSDPNGAYGGAPATFPNAVVCQVSPTASPSTCQIAGKNATTGGTVTVRVFDDTNSDGKFTAGEPSQDVTVTFTTTPFSINLTPDNSTVAAGNCATYTATATDAAGNPAAGWSLNLSAAETVPHGNTTDPAFCAVTNGSTVTPAGAPAVNGITTTNDNGTTQTNTLNGTATTDGSGKVIFGILSNVTGTVTITASSGSASDTSTETVVASGQNAVTTLSVSPTSFTGYTGTSPSFTVTATNGSTPIQGVTVNYFFASGDPDAAQASNTNPAQCAGTTNGSGQVTCTYTNNPPAAGTDHITFYVNQTNGAGPHTNGLDTGEPNTTATATFSTPPAISSANSTVTCATPGGTPAPGATCSIPPDQHSVTFTATVNDASNKPVSGAIVTWTFTGSEVTAGRVSPTSGQSTTDANGVATFTVTDSAPADTGTITATAKVGTQSAGSATATFHNRVPSSMTIKPALQTVTNGGAVSEVVTVVDQYGTGVSGQSITYTVSGRNAGKSGTVTTGSDGTAMINYTDTNVNPGSNSDTITATDTSANAPTAGQGNPATATVQYIAGSTTASSVTIDVSNSCNLPAGTPSSSNPGTSGAGSTSNGFNTTTTADHQVCALVKNSDGTALAGKSVTFTVDKGFVSATNHATQANSSSSVTVTTGSNGVAQVFVGSTQSGTQTVTAKSDNATASGTIQYGPPSTIAARNVSLAPPTATIAPPGSSQKFTATVIDEFGNPVPQVQVQFSLSGPGTIGGGSSSFQVTDANGQASVTVSTTSTDSGSGTLTADIGQFNFNNCNQPAGSTTTGGPPGPDANAKTAGNCTATSTYKVTTAAPPPPSAASLPAERAGSRNNFRGSLTSGPANSSFGFGNSGDVPLWGDWDGDGTPSMGVYRPSNRTFYLANNANTGVAIQVTIGNAGDLPAAGDFNGDGTDSIALFRPSTGMWYITNNDHSVAQSFRYGSNGDRPLVGDWTGSGHSSVGVYRPSTGQFFRIGHAGIRFGNIGDTPIVGDWDGNGTTTIGVVRGATWYVSNNNSSAAASFTFGATGDRPFTWSSGVSPAAPTSS